VTISTFLTTGIFPAMTLLPTRMGARAAEVMVVAIALQESRLKYRRQIKGPARGYTQFERGGVLGVLNHPISRPHALAVCEALDVAPTVDGVYEAIEFNDVLCAAFSRLLLYTLPWALPGPDAGEEGWRQYLAAWRPGKPHRGTWDEFYRQAWRGV
jgi:hypothetical protein